MSYITKGKELTTSEKSSLEIIDGLGTALQVLRTNAAADAVEWSTLVAGGTVTSVSVVSANGFAGTVATETTTPAITLTTSITGILKGNGTAISAATDGTDYLSSTTGVTLDQTSGQTIGVTGARLTKLWATDITVTNAIAGDITGNAGTATSATTATNLAGGSGGTIPYQSAAGTTAMLANGTAGQILQSNGTTLAPSWVAAGAGDVTKVGTPVDNQVGVWTGDGTIEGTAGLTYDGSNLQLTGDIGITGTRITKGWFTDLQVTNAITGAITGNASTATALETARTIGGTSFDGTANITVASATGGFAISGGDTTIADGNGVVIGHNAQLSTGNTLELQYLGTTPSDSLMLIGKFSADAIAGGIQFLKSRNATIGSNTIVQDNDKLGSLNWYADDGVDFATSTAQFRVEVDDASPAAGDIGSAFVWSHMPGGGGAMAETLRISAAGDLTIAVGDLGVTGTRVKKGWFTDLECTNAIAGSITGNAATVSTITGLAPDTATTQATQASITTCANLVTVGALASGSIASGFGTINIGTSNAVSCGTVELGHASDTTFTRVSAGLVSIEGANIMTVSSADTVTGVKTLGTTGAIKLGSAVTDKCDIRLNDSALNDETWSGTVIEATLGATIAVGDVCYLASSGKWLLNDGILDGTDTGFSKKLGICLVAGNDTDATKILLDGLVASAAFPAFTVGSPVYLDDTAGDLVVAQPSTTNFAIRVVGEAVSATVLHFHPSNDYIVHS